MAYLITKNTLDKIVHYSQIALMGLSSEEYLLLTKLYVICQCFLNNERSWDKIYMIYITLPLDLQEFFINISDNTDMKAFLAKLDIATVEKSIIPTNGKLKNPEFYHRMYNLFKEFSKIIGDAILAIDVLKKGGALNPKNSFAIIVDGVPTLTDQAQEFLEFRLSYK